MLKNNDANISCSQIKISNLFDQSQSSMTNYRIRLHETTSDQIWLNWRCPHRSHTACIPLVNQTPAPYSRKCLTYMMLEENPLFHAATIQCWQTAQLTTKPTYWELYILSMMSWPSRGCLAPNNNSSCRDDM